LSSGYWSIDISDNQPEEMQRIKGGPARFDASKPVTLTIMKKDTTNLFFLNSELLTSYDFHADNVEENFFKLLASSNSDNKIETIEFDNIKFWDLDKIEY
jgi:hypothetical protein